MTTSDGVMFASRFGMAATIAAVSIGASACATTTIKIDDLTLIELRRMDPKERRANPDKVPLYMNGDVYNDVAFIEASLSTSFDLGAAVRGSGDWQPYARKWQCALGEDEGWMDGRFEGVYEEWKNVGHHSAQAEAPRTVEPSGGSMARQVYTVYFATKDNVAGRGTLYDLARSPVDVCIRLAPAGYFSPVLLETNVVTIPAEVVELLATGPLH